MSIRSRHRTSAGRSRWSCGDDRYFSNFCIRERRTTNMGNNPFPGTIQVATTAGSTVTVSIDGDNARVSVGGGDKPIFPPSPPGPLTVPGHSGSLTVNNHVGIPIVQILSELGGFISICDVSGKQMFAIDAVDGALLRVGGDKRSGRIYLVPGDTPQNAPSDAATVRLTAAGLLFAGGMGTNGEIA